MKVHLLNCFTFRNSIYSTPAFIFSLLIVFSYCLLLFLHFDLFKSAVFLHHVLFYPVSTVLNSTTLLCPSALSQDEQDDTQLRIEDILQMVSNLSVFFFSSNFVFKKKSHPFSIPWAGNLAFKPPNPKKYSPRLLLSVRVYTALPKLTSICSCSGRLSES